MGKERGREGLSRRALLAAGSGAAGAAALSQPAEAAPGFARTADVIVVGSGATGLPAAIAAREAGASVIVLEAEPDVGGHAMVCGGNVALGGGTSRQRKYGVQDSPDLLFRDLTDWSVVEGNGAADYRFNDREIIRAFADASPSTFDWLVAHGVVFMDKRPDTRGGQSVGNSALRENHAVAMDWPMVQTGRPAPAEARATLSTGNGLMRPLEAAARKAGVEILLQHRMTALVREEPRSGRVLGVTVSAGGKSFNLRARKAVILGTGGSSGNVNFRRMFDPRLTEEYCGLAGMPWSNQDASGELAGMAVGASLWGLANQTGEFGFNLTKAGYIGCRYGYDHLSWEPGSRVFDRAGATGLSVTDWQNAILVNMLGRRFYDETADPYRANNYGGVNPYTPRSFRNASTEPSNPNGFLAAALAGVGDDHNGGGPIWAIFDAAGAAREKWDCQPPHVDVANGFFFQADTLAELARRIVMPHQRLPMPPENLEETVARYNRFVAAQVDEDFSKPSPRWTIAKPPFYAAWSTPVVHDTRAGLRINRHCQVVDMEGEIIPGLYCGGESAGGFSQHGVGRAMVQGLIAARHAIA